MSFDLLIMIDYYFFIDYRCVIERVLFVLDILCTYLLYCFTHWVLPNIPAVAVSIKVKVI